MSTEENKTIVRLYYEDSGKEDVIRRLREAEKPDVEAEKAFRASLAKAYAPECVIHTTVGDLSLEELIQMMVMVLTAFPDFRCTIEDIIAEGDKVVTRFTEYATHERSFQGIPATGKQVTIKAISIKRLANGKVVEDWIISDVFGMMQQLGAIPSGGGG